MFSSSSGVQINGGTFYNVARDINVQHTGGNRDDDEIPQLALTEGPSREPIRAERNQRHGYRTVPYDISRRWQTSSHSLPDDQPSSWTFPSSLALTPYSDPAQLDFAETSGFSAMNEHTFPPYDPLGNGNVEWETNFANPSRGADTGSLSFGNAAQSALGFELPPFVQPSVPSFAPFLQNAGPMNGPNTNIPIPPFLHPYSPDPVTYINGGTFIGGNMSHIQRQGETGLHILHRTIAGDAFHDSAERYPQPRCHPDTRTEMLGKLWSWACGNELPEADYRQNNFPFKPDDLLSEERNHPSSESTDVGEDRRSGILWLHGPAGSGKSAIAQSLCQKLQADDRLGGSFFFKRGDPSRGSAKKLFPTLAYQLALLLPSLHSLISQRMEYDPAIVNRSLPDQLLALIIEPCRLSDLAQPVSIIIDGLDECEGHDIQQEILRAIAITQQENLPLRFFIVSRPEPHITEMFREPGLDQFHRPFYIDQSFKDVRCYLEDEFKRIHESHHITMVTIPRPWPSPEVVELLVQKSSGYFIYAATVIRFVDDKNFRPTDRLDIILGIKQCGAGSPFGELDQLYLQILSLVPVESRPQLLRILTVITSYLPLNMLHIEQLLELKMGDCRLILRNLHSVISLPGDLEGDVDVIAIPGHMQHASFLDFLLDSSRSGSFCIGGAYHRADIACHILKVMNYEVHDPALRVRYDGWHVAWRCGPRALDYVESVEPSPKLETLLHSFNQDILFYHQSLMDLSQRLRFLNWLKKFNPLPLDLIRLWEDYEFMLSDDVWDTCRTIVQPGPSRNHPTVLSDISLPLLQLLYAYRLLLPDERGERWNRYKLHLLLDLPVAELRTMFCPLRTIVSEEQHQNQDHMRKPFIFNSGLTPLRKSELESLIWDLACGGLRVLKGVLSGELPHIYGTHIQGWSFFLRCCIPSASFLRSLEEISDDWPTDWYLSWAQVPDFHNIAQWLKTFPNPPIELISQFESRVKFMRDLKPPLRLKSFESFEEEWRMWQEEHKLTLVHGRRDS
ncbi:NACHT domain-containing protein [Mycena venus]|uniref:NACHT domain-containing protein n=1 Tax=Mycena venus TaxID=2733690 RepID=A0A8H6U3Y5_9AGAR|nr:NACHT domain-containing protein [Mycena venus]